MKINLDRRIALIRNIVTVDSGGTPIKAPAEVQNVWAQYKPISSQASQESFGADRELTKSDAEFVIRYSSEVLWLKAKDALKFDGDTYELASDPVELVRREYLLFKARLRDANAQHS